MDAVLPVPLFPHCRSPHRCPQSPLWYFYRVSPVPVRGTSVPTRQHLLRVFLRVFSVEPNHALARDLVQFEELKARDTEPSAADQSRAADYDMAVDRRIQEKIEETMQIKGITMECIGSWLWLSDNDVTRAHAEEIESLGYKFSKRRHRWYFTPKQKSERRYRGKKSFEEIREVHAAFDSGPGQS